MKAQDALGWFGAVGTIAAMPLLASDGFTPAEAGSAGTIALAAAMLLAWTNRDRVRWLLDGGSVGDDDVRVATVDDADAIHSMATSHFGPSVTDKAQIVSLIRKNRKMFWVLVDRSVDGTRTAITGYACLIPLSHSQHREIEQGQFGLNSISPSSVPRGASNVASIYIGAVVGVKRWARARMLGFTEDKARELARRSRTRTIFAKAVTADGLRLVTRKRFVPVYDAANGMNCFFKKVLD